jgi:mono/diheme cytochrome c family protein
MINLRVVALAGLLLVLGVGTAFAQDANVEKGKQDYDYWCATCHGEGRGRPATIALAAKYTGTDRPAVLAERTDLTPQTVSFFVRNGISIMPMFRKTEISDADLATIAAYLTRRRAAPTGAAPVSPRPRP